MQWFRRGTLTISVIFGLSVLALVIHTFWLTSQDNPPHLAKQVQDLQLLVIVLLAWAGFYSVAFLLAPILNDKMHNQPPRQLGNTIRAQLSERIGKIPELEGHLRQVTSGRRKAIQEAQASAGLGPIPRLALEAPHAARESATSEEEYLQLSGGLRILNSGMVRVYQALAALCGPEDHAAASSYLKQALGLGADANTAAEIHYSLACLLARQGKLGEALVEVQTAFANKSPELESRLAKDTEEGGALNELAAREPYARVLDDLLMAITIAK